MSERFYIANGKSATIKTESESNVNLRTSAHSTIFIFLTIFAINNPRIFPKLLNKIDELPSCYV